MLDMFDWLFLFEAVGDLAACVRYGYLPNLVHSVDSGWHVFRFKCAVGKI